MKSFINVVLVITLGLPAVSCANRLNDTGAVALYCINLIFGLVCLGVMMLVLVDMIKGTSKELKSVGEQVASKERLEVEKSLSQTIGVEKRFQNGKSPAWRYY